MQSDDTIVAIASAVGTSARMIVRLSGAQSFHIASRVARDPIATPAQHHRLQFSGLECSAWIYAFRAPGSYTGQDTIEFHLPGNPLLARLLLDELIRLGARPADPGEFTARGYFNGRMDLSQAEGVAAIIAANSASELRAAQQLLAGELARRVKPALDSLTDTLALVEVGIDFSEEDVEFLSANEIRMRLDAIDALLDDLLRDSARLERLHHTPQFVLVGRPNAGKSTLLNALAGEQRAVVSAQAGTTRDALCADVTLLRGMIRLIDVAGIDRTPIGGDEIERQMHSRAIQTMQTADRVVLVHDGTDASPLLSVSRSPDLVVLSKADLLQANSNPKSEISDSILVSAHSGQNMSGLRTRLDALAFGAAAPSTLALNARHIQAIQDARAAVTRAREQRAVAGPEILAVELRDALDSLGAILGEVTPDDVLGRIFSSFCIGK